MAKKSNTPSNTLESGQRWAYPLGDGRWIALQITEATESAVIALPFDEVFDSLPSPAQLDAAPWLRWNIGPVYSDRPAPRAFARCALRTTEAPTRATLIDTTAIRDDAELGPATVPSADSFATISLHVWQHWHHRTVTGAWGRAVFDRPHRERWQGATGDVAPRIAQLRDEPPPIVLSVGETALTTVDLRGVSAQAIVLDAGRGFRATEVMLPAHVHTLAVWGRHAIRRVHCAPEGPPLEVSLSDGYGEFIAGLESVPVVNVTYASSYGLRTESITSWSNAVEINVWTAKLSSFSDPAPPVMSRLQTLTLGAMNELTANNLPALAQLPALRTVHVDSACKCIKDIRERYKPQAKVVRFVQFPPSHKPREHQMTSSI
jgi:hypothetical protein